MSGDKGDWNQWANLVLQKLEDFDGSLEKLWEAYHSLGKELAVFQTEVTIKLGWRAAIFGLLGGSIPIAITLIIVWIKSKG